jgi:cytochrome c556
MNRFARNWIIAAGIALATLMHSVAAHEGATGIVKNRMDTMQNLAKAMKAITQRVKANRDLGSIKADARTIQQLAGKITSVFPPGSNEHPSEAKGAIWQKWSDFEAKAGALATESGKLAEADSRDVQSVTAQVRAVSQVCSGCHELYRAKAPKHHHM